MLITIITVCLNAEKTIEETLASIAMQNYREIDYVVVDGGSRDRTLSIIRGFENLKPRVVMAKGSTIYEAMNVGIDHAIGDVIGFLNADDCYASPKTLSEIASAFSESRADCIYGDLVIRSRTNPKRIIRYWKAGVYRQGAFKYGWMAPHPTFYVRSDKLNKIKFNTRYSIAADLDQQIRAFEIFCLKPFYLAKILVSMKSGGRSSGSLKALWYNLFEALDAIELKGVAPKVVYVIHVFAHRFRQFLYKM
jgi:glycosyltransferase involved in cell wall biosynthesis